MFIRLKPRDERTLSADQVIAQLRRKVAGVPGIKVYFQNPPPIRIGGRAAKSLYQLTDPGAGHGRAVRRGAEAGRAAAGDARS